jgi:hypothetical protein
MNAQIEERALATGLELRPLSDTLATASNGKALETGHGPHGAGPTDSEERELLATLT